MTDIQSVAQWIGKLLVDEATYLYKVGDKVKELQHELEWMQCFLQEADARQFDNAMARKWVAQIKELTYRAEDIIEEYVVKVVPCGGGRTDLLIKVKRISSVLWQSFLVHEIGSKISQLKHEISALSSKLNTYGIQLKVEGSLSSRRLTLDAYYSFKEDENIIGRDEDMEALSDWLLNLKGRQVVGAICGEGGVGKTFLAKKIFHDQEVRKKFDAFAWAYVSEPCQSSALRQEILSSLTSKSIEQITQMTDDELNDGLCKASVRTQSLIVLDGVCSTKVWDDIKAAFPLRSQGFLSRLMLTTREEKVAKHVAEDVYLHRLEPLGKDASSELLKKKVSHVPAASSDEKDDPRNLLDEMLKLCGGRPFLIVALGGILSSKMTLKEWKTVADKMKPYSTEPQEQQWRCILELSYYELPYKLKPCFLYFSQFPSNLQISTTKIVKLWEAEGLVSSTVDEETEDTLQYVAENCLAQLVRRSLVQVGSAGLTGKVKTCLLPAIVKEFGMSKASTVNWLDVGYEFNKETSGASSSSFSHKSEKFSRLAQKKFRRLGIYCSKSLDSLPPNVRNAKYVRSLLFFNSLQGDEVLIQMKKQTLKKAFAEFKYLRVLDMENIEMLSLPDEVGFLIHLRYLSLKGSWVSRLPFSVKNLRCLQTLDLRVLSFVCLRIPNVLHKMVGLVHLYLPYKKFIIRNKLDKLKLKGLQNLQTLSNFSCKSQSVEDLHSLIHLREFTSSDFISEAREIKAILASPSMTLPHMEYMILKIDGKVLEEDGNMLADFKPLHKLWVKGQIKRPIASIKLPTDNLRQLTFQDTKFSADPTQILENLTNLKRLSLQHASYEGTKMRFSSQSFKELTNLTLQGLEKLEELEVEKGAMPKLHRLEINRCWELHGIPDGFKNLSSLKDLALVYMPALFYKGWIPDPQNLRDREGWPDFSKVKHVPFVKISHVIDLQGRT